MRPQVAIGTQCHIIGTWSMTDIFLLVGYMHNLLTPLRSRYSMTTCFTSKHIQMLLPFKVTVLTGCHEQYLAWSRFLWVFHLSMTLMEILTKGWLWPWGTCWHLSKRCTLTKPDIQCSTFEGCCQIQAVLHVLHCLYHLLILHSISKLE